MAYPQVASGIVTPSLNPVAVTAATYTAKNGDLIEFGGGASTVVTLPAVSQGGVVVVLNQVGTFTVTVKTAEGTNTIAGILGSTGYVVPAGGTGTSQTQATFVADGTNWQRVA